MASKRTRRKIEKQVRKQAKKRGIDDDGRRRIAVTLGDRNPIGRILTFLSIVRFLHIKEGKDVFDFPLGLFIFSFSMNESAREYGRRAQ